MNVDSSYLDGSGRRVPASRARPSPRIPDGAYVQVAGSQAIYRIAGGAPLYVSPQYWSTLGAQPLTVITRQQFAALNPVSASGTLLEDPTAPRTGRLAARRCSSAIRACLPARNCADRPVGHRQRHQPAAHLNAVPANGRS